MQVETNTKLNTSVFNTFLSQYKPYTNSDQINAQLALIDTLKLNKLDFNVFASDIVSEFDSYTTNNDRNITSIKTSLTSLESDVTSVNS